MSESQTKQGTLYLVPVALGGEDAPTWLPPATLDAARALRTFFVEDAKSARRFLKAIRHPVPLQEIRMHLLNEHTKDDELDPLLALLQRGVDCGLVAEAGCPAVADPGAKLVRRAHATGIPVEPLVGPSSILLALMASGMNGQRFAFHGYLPVGRHERAHRLKTLDAQAQGETQIFIETPYRNAALLEALIGQCRGDTLLCIAVDLTLPTRFVEPPPRRRA